MFYVQRVNKNIMDKTCYVCNKSFSRAHNYRRHMLNSHAINIKPQYRRKGIASISQVQPPAQAQAQTSDQKVVSLSTISKINFFSCKCASMQKYVHFTNN